MKQWADTIPKTELLAGLTGRGHRITRADAPVAVPGTVNVHGDLWSEVTLSTA